MQVLSFCGWGSLEAALLETAAVAVHFKDVYVMGDHATRMSTEMARQVLNPHGEFYVFGDPRMADENSTPRRYYRRPARERFR